MKTKLCECQTKGYWYYKPNPYHENHFCIQRQNWTEDGVTWYTSEMYHVINECTAKELVRLLNKELDELWK